eukprot:gene10853-biopygen1088
MPKTRAKVKAKKHTKAKPKEAPNARATPKGKAKPSRSRIRKECDDESGDTSPRFPTESQVLRVPVARGNHTTVHATYSDHPEDDGGDDDGGDDDSGGSGGTDHDNDDDDDDPDRVRDRNGDEYSKQKGIPDGKDSLHPGVSGYPSGYNAKPGIEIELAGGPGDVTLH